MRCEEVGFRRGEDDRDEGGREIEEVRDEGGETKGEERKEGERDGFNKSFWGRGGKRRKMAEERRGKTLGRKMK